MLRLQQNQPRVNKTANMAAKGFYRKSFLLLLFHYISSTASEKRFSDLKRCADDECSMLLCRGKALSDFTGPDCRFLSFKKSETVFVYYKLAGRRTDIWAGSVSSRFGYFPKDLLAVNHVYTDKELEVRAEETDFVCFDTGFDGFDDYDIDSLLSSSLLPGNDNNDNSDPEEENKVPVETVEEIEPPTEEVIEAENVEDEVNPDDFDTRPDDQSASLPQFDKTAESLSLGEGVSDSGAEADAAEVGSEDAEKVQSATTDAPSTTEAENPTSDGTASSSEPAVSSDGRPIPELKTTFGETFDAVVTDDRSTWKVTPYEEEESEELEDPSMDNADENDTPKGTQLLSFSEERETDALESDPVNEHQSLPTKQEDEPQKTEAKNMWTSIGDTVFAIVSGGERTADVLSSEEDDEDEEDVVSPNPQGTEEQKEATEPTKEPEVVEELEDHTKPKTVEPEVQKRDNDFEPLLFDYDDSEDIKMAGHGNTAEETSTQPPDEQNLNKKTTDDTAELNREPRDGFPVDRQAHELKSETLDEPTHKLASEKSSVQEDHSHKLENKIFDYHREKLSSDTDVKKTVNSHQDSSFEPKTGLPVEEEKSKDTVVKDHTAQNEGAATIKQYHRDSLKEILKRRRMAFDEPELDEDVPQQEAKPSEDSETDTEEEELDKEELLEDENALLSEDPFPSYPVTGTIEPSEPPSSTPEPEYSDSILRLVLLREHFEEDDMERLQKILGLKNLFKVEFMFSDLETELQAARRTQTGTTENIEKSLDAILEASETPILDEIEKMLDNRDPKAANVEDDSMFDEEAAILDDFQELAFSLRQKYSAVKDSAPLAADGSPETEEDNSVGGHIPDVEEEVDGEREVEVVPQTPEDGSNITKAAAVDGNIAEEPGVQDKVAEEAKMDGNIAKVAEMDGNINKAAEMDSNVTEAAEMDSNVTEGAEMDGNITEGAEMDGNIAVSHVEEKLPVEEKEEVQPVVDEVHKTPNINLEEDGGHFNKNKDNQPSFKAAEELPKVPQAILEKAFDVGLGVDLDHSSPGSLDSMEPVSDVHEEEEWGLFSTGMLYASCLLGLIKTKSEEWVVLMISLLPDDYKPGETFFGCPWQAVVVTALVGVVTFTLFFWRTVLAVKKRQFLVDEKGLVNQIETLKKEKEDAVSKMSELQKQSEELKEKQKHSEKTTASALRKNQDLESKILEAETRNQEIAEERGKFARLLEEEKTNSLKNDSRIQKLEKSNEKLQQSRKKTQEALAKTTVLLDEAKIREDARNVQHKCLERDFTVLKEENKKLKTAVKDWEEKHKELNEKIKVYQKSQKELEDSVVLKDHNVEVLSDLLADLDACDLKKGDGKSLANGEVATDKKTAIKNRIKQMMDVSRVQTTLTVVEEERDRFMTKLLHEEKARRALEEQHRELEHSIGSLKSDKSQVENQLKVLQQKNEIMTEMYQQKENALQQRLTKEELERRSKETLLSEVGGKAVEAEEQVKVLRQRINEMEEQMKKTEEVYKEQIKEQENKTHSNWVTARNAERALNQEKGETLKLREKLAVLTAQLNERRAPLFRPNTLGQPVVHRQGDSYGPSPVSGGAPSPPPMMEGPRRPPSAPVGRRSDPYGPRPPSDPHGRYPDSKHNSGLDMMAPRTSSPAQMDVSGPGSFIASPIRDSPGPGPHGPPPGPHGPPPGPGVHGPPLGPGPNPMLPPGPHSRLPHPGPHRLPRPNQGPHGPWPQGPPPPNLPPPHGPPANGHPGMLPPGPMGGDHFAPRPPNGHAYRPRPGPGPGMDPRGLPPPHFRPPPPHLYGPLPPPHGLRGPPGPRPPFPPDMRIPGPRDHAYPPQHLPPGGVPPPAHGEAFTEASAAHHTGVGQGQDFSTQQSTAAPQNSVNPSMTEP